MKIICISKQLDVKRQLTGVPQQEPPKPPTPGDTMPVLVYVRTLAVGRLAA